MYIIFMATLITNFTINFVFIVLKHVLYQYKCTYICSIYSKTPETFQSAAISHLVFVYSGKTFITWMYPITADRLVSFDHVGRLFCSRLDPQYHSRQGLKDEDNREVQVTLRASGQQLVLPQQTGQRGLHF
jgi:hypothetical protein